jgi:hypothetical protein
MSTTDGGPAFPQDNDAIGSPGMTLRDYFAAKAMQSVLQGARLPGLERTPIDPDAAAALDAVALGSYRIADAMLKERNK